MEEEITIEELYDTIVILKRRYEETIAALMERIKNLEAASSA